MQLLLRLAFGEAREIRPRNQHPPREMDERQVDQVGLQRLDVAQ